MKVPIDECPAGPEMDAAIAMLLEEGEIFKLSEERWYLASNQAAFERVTQIGDFCFESEDDFCDLLAPYSSGITAAWELAELCKHGRFGVGWSEDWGIPYCILGDIHIYADTVPLAICRAFLRANGVTEIEMPDEVSP